MMNRRPYWWVLILIWLAACQPQAETAQLPTVMVLPSVTPSFTPTLTPTPTRTPIPTFTPTPTDTPTITPSVTPTATLTPVPSATPTNTLTPTPTVTPSITATPTPIEPAILAFNASASQVEPGQPVTLNWQADADRARIERVAVTGEIVEAFEVQVNGSVTVNVPTSGAQTIYRLVVARGGRQTSLSVPIKIGLNCPYVWFFDPAKNDICPSGPQFAAPGAFQSFQLGYMWRVQVNTLSKTCGYQRDLNRYTCYNFVPFTSGAPFTPPAGFQPPMSDVADAFYTQLAVGGNWAFIIGWGTSVGASNNFLTQLDTTSQIYMQLPDGVYRFDAGLSSGTMTRIK